MMNLVLIRENLGGELNSMLRNSPHVELNPIMIMLLGAEKNFEYRTKIAWMGTEFEI